jgi:hypothetical protein
MLMEKRNKCMDERAKDRILRSLPCANQSSLKGKRSSLQKAGRPRV